MHIGEIGNEEVLVITDDSGHAAVHFPEDVSRAPLLFKLPLSAWGIDTHSSKRLVAISCNAHVVTIFHLGMGIEGWDWTFTLKEGDTFPSIVLEGHVGNIPCVAFDRTGSFIASGSLDYHVHLWDCKTGLLLRRFEAIDG
jgi:WD40 repeat protein